MAKVQTDVDEVCRHFAMSEWLKVAVFGGNLRDLEALAFFRPNSGKNPATFLEIELQLGRGPVLNTAIFSTRGRP